MDVGTFNNNYMGILVLLYLKLGMTMNEHIIVLKNNFKNLQIFKEHQI